MEKIILDCDPGHDDALAIMLAAGNPAIDLLGITTVAGNQTLPKVTRNALSVCAVAGIEVPVAAGADHRGVGPAVDPVERRVIGAVEEVLHQAAHRGQVLGRGEEVAVGAEHVVRLCVMRVEQHRAHRRFHRRTSNRGLGHLPRAARHRVVDDQ